MKLIKSEKTKAVYLLETPKFMITVTLMDMGNYVGHRDRPFGSKEPQIWKTMNMEIQSKETNKSFHVENLVDDQGRILRTLIQDGNSDIRRVRQYYYDFLDFPQERITQLRGPGTYWDNGRWVQDTLSIWKNHMPANSYYYDKETGLFMNTDTSKEHLSIESAPESPLTQPLLTSEVEMIGYQIEGAFNKERFKSNDNPEEIFVTGLDVPDTEDPEL